MLDLEECRSVLDSTQIEAASDHFPIGRNERESRLSSIFKYLLKNFLEPERKSPVIEITGRQTQKLKLSMAINLLNIDGNKKAPL